MSTKRGFILMNIGSPNEPSEKEIRNFLNIIEKEDIVDLPWPVRALLHKTAKADIAALRDAYQSIWSGSVSPMVHYCTQLTSKLQDMVEEPVVLGMAYGHPSYKGAIERLLAAEVTEICVLPLFAQYALATVGTCVERIKRELKHLHSHVALRVAPPFYNHEKYVDAIAASLNLSDEHVIFNYHGYPIRHLHKTDTNFEHHHQHCTGTWECCATCSLSHDTCYRFQCLATSRGIAEAAGIGSDSYSTTFQSHADSEKWIAPFTEDTLRELPAKGKKRVAIACPALFCDCLETLEEIEIRSRKTFMEAGGESFRMIHCLNDTPEAQHCLETLISHAGEWPPAA